MYSMHFFYNYTLCLLLLCQFLETLADNKKKTLLTLLILHDKDVYNFPTTLE